MYAHCLFHHFVPETWNYALDNKTIGLITVLEIGAIHKLGAHDMIKILYTKNLTLDNIQYQYITL